MKRRARLPVLLFLTTYAALTIPFALWPSQSLFLGILTLALYCVLAAVLAIEIAELVLAFLWAPYSLAQCSGMPARHKVAVAMTVCDDGDAESLSHLFKLTGAGYDTFVLDDSVERVELSAWCDGHVRHLWRSHRRGAKAGNLNHWLAHFGGCYEFLVVMDADSIITISTMDTLLRTAEHPDNAQVAIFQSKIQPRSDRQSVFGRGLSAGVRARARVLERVHSPLGLLLSFGHNQLLRLEPIRRLGGFPEFLSCEDTALSLLLAVAGWRTELVDVWSCDGDPQDVRSFNRRTIRWARQTVEVFRYGWHEVPLRLKLLMSWHLMAHASPLVGIVLLGFSLWCGPAAAGDVAAFVAASLTLRVGSHSMDLPCGAACCS